MTTKIADAFFGMAHPTMAFILKRFRHDGDRQNAQFARNARHNRRGPGAGSAAHAGRDEDHVGPVETFANFILAFQRRISPDFRLGPGPQSAGPLRPDLNLIGCAGSLQRLHDPYWRR